MNEDKHLIESCPRCELTIKQGGHWDIFYCLKDLKARNRQQEKVLIELCTKRDKASKINYLSSKIIFLSSNFADLINCASNPDNADQQNTIMLCIKELYQNINEIRKELGIL